MAKRQLGAVARVFALHASIEIPIVDATRAAPGFVPPRFTGAVHQAHHASQGRRNAEYIRCGWKPVRRGRQTFRMLGSAFRTPGSPFRKPGSAFRTAGNAFRKPGSAFRTPGGVSPLRAPEFTVLSGVVGDSYRLLMAKKNTSKHAASANPYPELPPRVTIDALADALPKATSAEQKLLLRGLDVESAVEWGVQADTQDILDDVPGYIGEGVNILQGLGPRFSAVHLPTLVFHAVVVETQALVVAKKAYDDKTSVAAGANHGKRGDLRAAIRNGVAARDKAVTALRNALGKTATLGLDAAVGDASSPENLARGLRAVATFLDTQLDAEDEDVAASLELWNLSSDTSTELTAAADKLAGFGDASVGTRRVEQRKLDEQDGRVLYLLDMIDRAFRQARRADATILVPSFRNLAGVFGRRRNTATTTAPVSQPSPAPPAPPVPPNTTTSTPSEVPTTLLKR